MKTLRASFAIIGEFHRAYITLNLLFYGLVVVGMILAFFIPNIQNQLLGAVNESFGEGPLERVAGAYLSQNIPLAVAYTFVVNVVLGTFVGITLPSLIVPFVGLLMGVYRPLLWGLIFSPTSLPMAFTMIPHSITLLLEGQGYVLGLLAAYVHGRAWITPQSVGAVGHWAGYKAGLARTLRLYLLVVLTLLAAAIYEALEVIAMLVLTQRLGLGA